MPQMRGRVMALYGMIFRAGPALGALLIGSLSERFGLRLPLAIGAQTLIQASVEPQMRGRVMALYAMIFRAGPALGALLIGSLSERFGLRLPLAIGAVISVA